MQPTGQNVNNANFSNIMNTSAHETSIQVFQNSQFGEIRTILINGKPFFCLQDICKSLGLSNVSRLKTRLLEKGFTTSKVLTNGGYQEMIFIDEPNLYKCIFQSRKKEAEEFQDWVTSEVLPAIRKTGGYIQTAPQDTPEMIMAKALRIANETINNHQQRVQMLEGENQIYREEITKLEPKARYTDEVLQSTSTFTATQMSDHFGITTIKFNNILKEKGIQYKQSGQWHLTAKYKNMGLTEIRVGKYVKGDEIGTNNYMVWTEKGRKFLVELFKSAE